MLYSLYSLVIMRFAVKRFHRRVFLLACCGRFLSLLLLESEKSYASLASSFSYRIFSLLFSYTHRSACTMH
jgi:hypothetical protein